MNNKWAEGVSKLTMATGYDPGPSWMGQRVGTRQVSGCLWERAQWAHGKFQDAYESVRSGHTERVCECLSGHTESFRMPMRVCAVGTQSGCVSAWVGTRRVSGCPWECAQWAHIVGVRMLEWAGFTARKWVVPREWAHGGCVYAWVGRFNGEEASGATRVGTRWVCVYLRGQDPRRGSEWCHVDAARDYAVAQQWCSSSAQVVAARRLYMYIQWDIQYIQGLQRGVTAGEQAAPRQRWCKLEVHSRSEEVVLHAWYIYTHAAGWQAGEMARGLGVTDEREVRRARLQGCDTSLIQYCLVTARWKTRGREKTHAR